MKILWKQDPIDGLFMCFIIIFRLDTHQCLFYILLYKLLYKGTKIVINWSKQNSKDFSLSISSELEEFGSWLSRQMNKILTSTQYLESNYTCIKFNKYICGRYISKIKCRYKKYIEDDSK